MRKRTKFSAGGDNVVYKKSDAEMKRTGNRGNIVRVGDIYGYPRHSLRQAFYDNHIIRILFPDNVVHFGLMVKPEEWGRNGELHSKEVPSNKELDRFNREKIDCLNGDGILSKPPALVSYRWHNDAVRSCPEVKKVSDMMNELGIEPGCENASNVSIANPESPVFFESYIRDPEKLLSRLDGLPISDSKKARIRRLLEIRDKEPSPKR